MGWHRDNETFLWSANLSVSVSFGTRALFKWSGKSCLDSEASSCWLDHGDHLVMDGQCQDEFLHCTDSGLEQERIDTTFRWIRQHVAACPLRTGAVLFCQRLRRVHPLLLRRLWGLALFGFSGCSQESCSCGRYWLCLFTPHVYRGLGYAGVPIAGHAHRAEVGGCIVFVASWEVTGQPDFVPDGVRGTSAICVAAGCCHVCLL